MKRNYAKPCGAALMLLALSGCASLGIPEQRQVVSAFAKSQGFPETPMILSPEMRVKADASVSAQLAAPLTQEAAVRIAIATSPTYQAMRASLEAQSATLAASAQPPNPLFTFERLLRNEGGAVDFDIGRMLATSLFDWLSLPTRLASVERQQAMQRTLAAQQLTQTVANVRQAWVRAVAAQQSAAYFKQVREAAEASAELARRMQAVGNFSKLQRAREQAFYADATTQQARAQHTALAAREALVRALGLTTAQAEALTLPERLPDMPTAQKTAPQVSAEAIGQRLDVKLAAAELEHLGALRDYTNVASLIPEAHIAGLRNSETGKPSLRGYEIELPIPLFSWGEAKRREHGAHIRAAEHRLADTTRRASSQLREAYGAYATSYDIAKHYQMEIVPLRKAIADEMLLKYNGMLVGVFELLADAREQIGSVIQAIDAQRDFWLADAALGAATLGAPIESTNMMSPATMRAGESKGH